MAATCTTPVALTSACRSVSGRKAAAGAPVLAFAPLRSSSRQQRRAGIVVKATMGGGGDKTKLTREEEPDEYWQSKGERDGANPLKDPLALIGIVSIFLPFIMTLVAIATGVVELP